MNEFIKIGEAANMFNTIKNADVVQSKSIMAKPSSMKQSNNSTIIVIAILTVGVAAYFLFKNAQKKKEEINKI
jgi:hypothetical protein